MSTYDDTISKMLAELLPVAEVFAKALWDEKERREQDKEAKPHEFKRGDKVRYIGPRSLISGWCGTVSEASQTKVRGVWNSGANFILRSADLELLPPSEDPNLTQPEQPCPWEVGQELECIEDGPCMGDKVVVHSASQFKVKWERGIVSTGGWKPSDFKAVAPKPTHRFKVGDVIAHICGSGIEYKITALRDDSDEYGADSNIGIQYECGHFKSDDWKVIRHEPPSDPAPQWQEGDVVLSSDGNVRTLQRKNNDVWHVTYCGPNHRHGYGLAAESIFIKLLHRPSDSSAEAKS